MKPKPRVSIAAAASVLLAAAAGAAELVKPAYPIEVLVKPHEVDVVVRASLDDAGKPDATEVVYNGGEGRFGDAAATAMTASTFAPGKAETYIWYIFRLAQDTLTEELTPGGPPTYDEPPTLTEATAPTFPPGAPSLRTEVPLDLLVGKDGRVWCARPGRDGVNPLYVERALAAAREFIFEPPTRGGAPVTAWYPFVIEFK